MALTNDQITAQNFKDFYEQIRPYLNGQVPTFANQFSRSDLYSTDEKIIGQWIDGKPLYQKTFETTTPANNTDTLIVELPSNCIARSFDGYILQSGYNHIPLNAHYSSAEFVCTYMQFNPDNGIRMKCENTQWRSSTAVITVRYTKTTDSAIKVGTGTDYSTDEQIIGTWIDGKPLYQKTIELTNVSLPEAQQVNNVTLLSNATYNYIDSNGIIVSSSGNVDVLPLIDFDRTKGSIYYGARVRRKAQNKDIVLNLVNYNGSSDTYTVSVTIRYTKTTD